MFPKRIVGGRGSLIGCALLIAVACASGADDVTSDPAEDIPGAGGSHRATQDGSGGAGTGPAAATSSSAQGGTGRAATDTAEEGGASADPNTAEEPSRESLGVGGENLGAGGESDGVEVLALEDCNLAAPFDPPVAAFTGTTIAEGVTFSQDERTAFVSSKANSSSYDIYVATRTSTSVPFGALSSLGPTFNNVYDERSPFLSADGLRLYLTRFGSSWDVMVSTRGNVNESFSAYTPMPVGGLVNVSHDQDPFFRAGTNELYFASEANHGSVNPNGTRKLYVSTWQGGGSFTTPVGLSVNLATVEDDRPIVSPDGLTLYFASQRPGIGGDTSGDIFIAKRNNLTENFGTPTNLYALNTWVRDFPAGISSNGCTLYFASTRDTGTLNHRLYQATRGSSIPSTVTTSIKIFGTGSVITPGYQCSANCAFQGPPDSTVYLQASGNALWTGSCTSNNGNPSTDGVFVFTPGGTCTVTFATGSPGGSGSGCNEPTDCQAGLECTLGTCRCPGGAQCSAQCPCGPGGSCTAQNQCQAGLACTNGMCSCPAGSPCSAQCPCGLGGSCSSTSQCQQGLTCTNGVCDTPSCPRTCAEKTCGADSNDGCGGQCLHYCEDREAGCTADFQCPIGSVCLPGAGPSIGLAPGVNICLPAQCVDPEPDPSECGTIEDVCGLCPVCREENPCANTSCGPDPFGCGVDCDAVSGGCSEGSCVAGQCQLNAFSTVVIPDPSNQSETMVIDPLPPESTSEVGATPGTFTVSDRGTATYDVPIVVPPGRAGLQPEIGFRYTSTSENGQLGVGWSLSGLSMITRCPKTHAIDGWPAPVRMDEDDAFCIDGKRMLFHDYDESLGGDVYGTQPTDFSRIVGVGSPVQGYEYFKVWTKSGRILYYGTDENARVARIGGPVRSWHLSRVADRAGNYMDIKYHSVGAYLTPNVPNAPPTALPNICTLAVETNGTVPPACENPEINIASISYGGFSGPGIEVPHTRTVVFDYQGRADRIEGYRPGGGRFTRTTLLESVTTYVREQPVRTYHLRYLDALNDLSELRGISECAHDAAGERCKPETKFDYQLLPRQTFGELIETGIDPGGFGGMTFGDFDGDGLNDIIAANVVEASNPNLDPAYEWFMLRSTDVGGASFEYVDVPLSPDFDEIAVFSLSGDAKDDLFRGKALGGVFSGDTRYFTRYFRSVGIVDVPIPGLPSGLTLAEGLAGLNTDARPEGRIHLADVDGDQYLDSVFCRPDATWGYAQRVKGFPWLPEATTPLGGELDTSFNGGDCEDIDGIVDDDGDGANNVLIDAGSSSYVGTGDFNGDGLVDMFVHFDRTITIKLNKGTGTYEPYVELAVQPLFSSPALALDVNSDGYDDLVMLWSQAQFRKSVAYGPSFSVVEDFFPDEALRDWKVADINGDSSPDLVIGAGGLRVHLGQGARANLLTQVTDGMGKQYTIRYDAVRSGVRTYTVGEACPYPTKCVRDPGPLVSEYEVHQVKGIPNPTGAPFGEFKQRRFAFTYADAKTDTRGWGWLGFGERTIDEFDGADTFIRQHRIKYHNGPSEISNGYPARFVFAGLVDESVTVSAAALSEIDGPNPSAREERAFNHYSKKTSVEQNPFEFPFLDNRTTQVSELYQDATSGETIDSTVLWTTLEVFDVDEFGNQTTYDRASAKGEGGLILETHSTDTFYDDIRLDDWLISLATRVEDGDALSGGPAMQTRTTQFTYDERGLLVTDTREPEDVPDSAYYRLVTTLTRTPESLWNVDVLAMDDADSSTPERAIAFDYDDDKIFVERKTQQVDVGEGVVDHVTQYTYDERHGQVSTIVDPSYVTTRMAFDGFGRLRRWEQAAEVTTVTYETADPNAIPQARAVLRTTSETLTPHQGGMLRRVNSKTVDSFGRTVRTYTSAPNQVFQEVWYDDAGRVAFACKTHGETFNPADHRGTSYQYDDRGRLILETYPDGTFSSFDYAVTHGGESDDYLGIAFTKQQAMTYRRTTDPEGNVTLHALDMRGNMVANYFNGLADVNTYDYAPFDVPYRTTDAAGNDRVTTPDRYGRIEAIFDLDRGPSESRFTAFGEVASTTTADNVTNTFTYDALGRIRTLQNSVDGTVEWFYDDGPGSNINDVGKLVEVVRYQEGHSEQYSYQPYAGVNNRGLLEEVTRNVRTLKNPNDEAVARTYSTRFERDPGSGLVTIAHLPEAGTTQTSPVLNLVHGYDERGYLKSLSSADGIGGNEDPLYLWQRRSLHIGHSVKEFSLGGHVEGGGAIRGNVDFDPLSDEVLSLRYTDFDDSTVVIEGATYTYDDNGNMETMSRHAGKSELYMYDSLDRLNHVVTTSGPVRDFSYIYDATGNIDTAADSATGTMAYDYDHGTGWLPHAVRAAGDYEFDYTPRGAVYTRTNVETGAQQTFDYMGAFDLPKRIETSQGEDVTATELEYSPLGGRVIKRARGSDDTILSEIQYIGDELEVHHHPDDSYEYVYNVFIGGSQIARVTLVEQTPGGGLSDSAVEFLLADTLGTPRTVAGAGGEVLRTQSEAPTPFGQVNPPPIGPGFTGHRHDQDIELIDMRGRLYDPVVGRFMQADPIIARPYFSEGLNPYTYAVNSPMSWVDPSGLQGVPSTWPETDEHGMPIPHICGANGCGSPPPPNSPPPNGNYRPKDGGYVNSSGYGGPGAPIGVYPVGGGQWGPGNSPGDISPERRNELCAGQTGSPCNSSTLTDDYYSSMGYRLTNSWLGSADAMNLLKDAENFFLCMSAAAGFGAVVLATGGGALTLGEGFVAGAGARGLGGGISGGLSAGLSSGGDLQKTAGGALLGVGLGILGPFTPLQNAGFWGAPALAGGLNSATSNAIIQLSWSKGQTGHFSISPAQLGISFAGGFVFGGIYGTTNAGQLGIPTQGEVMKGTATGVAGGVVGIANGVVVLF
jgi:RHS repeat-associated protein